MESWNCCSNNHQRRDRFYLIPARGEAAATGEHARLGRCPRRPRQGHPSGSNYGTVGHSFRNGPDLRQPQGVCAGARKPTPEAGVFPKTRLPQQKARDRSMMISIPAMLSFIIPICVRLHGTPGEGTGPTRCRPGHLTRRFGFEVRSIWKYPLRRED